MKNKAIELKRRKYNATDKQQENINHNNNVDDFEEKNEIQSEVIEMQRNKSKNVDANPIEININDDKSEIDLTIEEEQEVEEGNLDQNQIKQSKYFQYKLPLLEYLADPIEIIEHNHDELTEKGKQLKYALNTYFL